MKKFALTLAALLISVHSAIGQAAKEPPTVKPTVDSKALNAAALDLARSALAAHGGDKLKAVKTMVIRGSVDLTSPSIPQAIPSGFSIAYAGDKYRLELVNPFQTFKQSFDGTQTYTSIPAGVALPPINRLGLPLLQRLGDEGFVVSSLPETTKKKSGFRITAPDGYYTDFFVDEKTRQVKGYEAMYEYSGRMYTTSVEIGKYRVVEGVLVPEKYSQRFDLGLLVVYGDFRSKDILLNTEISSDAFTSVK